MAAARLLLLSHTAESVGRCAGRWVGYQCIAPTTDINLERGNLLLVERQIIKDRGSVGKYLPTLVIAREGSLGSTVLQ